MKERSVRCCCGWMDVCGPMGFPIQPRVHLRFGSLVSCGTWDQCGARSPVKRKKKKSPNCSTEQSTAHFQPCVVTCPEVLNISYSREFLKKKRKKEQSFIFYFLIEAQGRKMNAGHQSMTTFTFYFLYQSPETVAVHCYWVFILDSPVVSLIPL